MSRIEDSNHDAAAEPHGAIVGRPLYSRAVHRFVRVAFGTMGVFFAIAVIGMMKSIAEEQAYWIAVAGAPVLALCTLILATYLRTSALYGSSAGLEVVRWGKRRVIPWSKVGKAEYAWWSTSRVARVATVTLQEEKETTVIFFANDPVLADLETMRALYTRS